MVAGIVALSPALSADSPAHAASASCPAGEPCVIVTVVGSEQSEHVVTLADVQAGGLSASYQLRGQAGGPIGSDIFTGISIRDMLQDDVGLAIGSVTFTDTTVGASGDHLLSPADLADPSSPGYPYLDGRMPAIFLASQSLGYIEPLEPGSEPNTTLYGAPDGPILMTVHTAGHILKPVVTASTPHAHAKAPVSFTASFASPPGTALSYSWQFGAGPAVTGTSPTIAQSYSHSGTYRVTVTVTGADGSFGISPPITVTVGAPVPPTKGPGTGTSPSPGPTTGPNTGSGTRAGTTPSSTPSTSQANGATTGGDASGNAASGGSKLPQVIGTIISGSREVDPVAKSSAARATAPAATVGGLTGFAWTWIAVAGGVVLLALGVVSETGVLRRRSPRAKSQALPTLPAPTEPHQEAR